MSALSDFDVAPLQGAKLLDAVRGFLGRFVAFPSEHALTAVALWAAHAHAVDCFESTPRLALLSPEPGSGKTRGLEVLETLVPRPMFTMNASVAALFRKVSDPDGRPVVLLDEADTIFGPRSAKEHEDLRGFVNAGHRRGAMATRCVVRGKSIEVEDYPCYAAVALAGLDDLPDTVMTRAVVIRMRRRAPYEHVSAFRHRVHAAEGKRLGTQLAAWTGSVAEAMQDAWPKLPDGVEDRAADVWEPLLAIADQAGGEWPTAARDAAVAFVADSQKGSETLGVKLLRDLKGTFEPPGADVHDKLATEAILTALAALEESPWGDLRGKPLDARGLARRLSKYGVKPKSVRIEERTPKGYERADLLDAWARYLPAPSEESATTATPQQDDGQGPESATSDRDPVADVADTYGDVADNEPPDTGPVSLVADVADLPQDEASDPEPMSREYFETLGRAHRLRAVGDAE